MFENFQKSNFVKILILDIKQIPLREEKETSISSF